MAKVVVSRKACSVNPLKLSRPMGGVTAFLGLDGCIPMLHGAQGCTAFGLVLLVKHFREGIAFQTSAMNEVSTILGGRDNLEQALVTIAAKSHPKIVAICSNGLMEARGEDIAGDLKLIRRAHPELDDTVILHAATPDYKGAFQDGWADALTAIVETLVQPSSERDLRRVNVLAGSHLTAADIEEIRDIVAAFGLEATILPDLSGSLDGHVAGAFTPATDGGTSLDDIRRMGSAIATLAIGEGVRGPAERLETRCHIPAYVFPRLTGLLPNDEFVATLSRLSGRPVPMRLRRWRSQLLDAMLDGHFHFGGRKVAVAAEPDLLFAYSQFLNEMGAIVAAAVTTTDSPILGKVPADTVIVGDLDDVEREGAGCTMLIANSQARRTAERMGAALVGVGMPVFDRLGAAHRLAVGYRGTRTLIFEIANQFLAETHAGAPGAQPGGPHAALAAH